VTVFGKKGGAALRNPRRKMARHGARDDRVEIAVPEAYWRFNLARVETPWAAVNPDFLCAACRSLTNGFTEAARERRAPSVSKAARSRGGSDSARASSSARGQRARTKAMGKYADRINQGKYRFKAKAPRGNGPISALF